MFFNSSMPRSGSELLQVLLHQNPDIYASATSPLLEFQYGARMNLGLAEVQSQNSEMMESAFISMCSGMAESYYKPITDRPHIIDKNRGWLNYYEWVEQWHPAPKMICMVRDLRSVLASMERIFRKSRHLPIGPDNPADLLNITVQERVNHWLNTQPVGLALKRLADVFMKQIDHKVLFVRYEDLCETPQGTMDKVYKYLGLPSFKHDFENIEKEVEENDTFYGPYGNHSVGKILLQANDWRDILEPELADIIKQNNQWFFTKFNYM